MPAARMTSAHFAMSASGLKRIPGRDGGEFQISNVGAETQSDARTNGDDDDIVERKSRHPQSPNEIRRTLDADKALIDRVGGRKIVDEHHGARAIAAKIKTERGPLPVDPTVAGILGVQHALPVTQTGDPGTAGLLPQDISVGQAPLAACFFDDLSEPVRDRTEKPVPCVNDLVRGVLPTLQWWIASKWRTASRRRTAGRRRIRLREGRFAAPRDEGQNQEGGPHHSLHRVLHSRESCSTVTDEIVRMRAVRAGANQPRS